MAESMRSRPLLEAGRKWLDAELREALAPLGHEQLGLARGRTARALANGLGEGLLERAEDLHGNSSGSQPIN